MIHTTDTTGMAMVIDTLVLGFAADPVMRWLMPEPQDYLATFPEILRLFGGGAFRHGGAYHNADQTCAAMWLPPGVHPDEDGLGALFEARYSGDMLATVYSLFEQMDGFHPDEACFHLAFIASDPIMMGKGLGAAMMQHNLKVCDADNKIAYLESTNAANLSLYTRYGFEQIGKIEADGAPSLYPMLRQPR